MKIIKISDAKFEAFMTHDELRIILGCLNLAGEKIGRLKVSERLGVHRDYLSDILTYSLFAMQDDSNELVESRISFRIKKIKRNKVCAIMTSQDVIMITNCLTIVLTRTGHWEIPIIIGAEVVEIEELLYRLMEAQHLGLQ
jgi:hypothetical protein